MADGFLERSIAPWDCETIVREKIGLDVFLLQGKKAISEKEGICTTAAARRRRQ